MFGGHNMDVVQWAQLTTDLVAQLPPIALSPLAMAFGQGGAASIPVLFQALNGYAAFTNRNSGRGNIEMLMHVLDPYSEIEPVYRIKTWLRTGVIPARGSFHPTTVNVSVAVQNTGVAQPPVRAGRMPNEPAGPLAKIGPGPEVLKNKAVLMRVPLGEIDTMMTTGFDCQALVLPSLDEVTKQGAARMETDEKEADANKTTPQYAYAVCEVKYVLHIKKAPANLEKYML